MYGSGNNTVEGISKSMCQSVRPSLRPSYKRTKQHIHIEEIFMKPDTKNLYSTCGMFSISLEFNSLEVKIHMRIYR
jgi:hypothetical protein